MFKKLNIKIWMQILFELIIIYIYIDEKASRDLIRNRKSKDWKCNLKLNLRV
jgi:Ni,Fe-hydrogenase I cytochrome b subunit